MLALCCKLCRPARAGTMSLECNYNGIGAMAAPWGDQYVLLLGCCTGLRIMKYTSDETCSGPYPAHVPQISSLSHDQFAWMGNPRSAPRLSGSYIYLTPKRTLLESLNRLYSSREIPRTADTGNDRNVQKVFRCLSIAASAAAMPAEACSGVVCRIKRSAVGGAALPLVIPAYNRG